jgi:hypothetical protein
VVTSDTSTLAAWLHHPATRKRGHRAPPPVPGSLRFAFYGRVSTADRQEPAVSRRWQYEVATDTIGDAGSIVRDFFDIGCSRSIPWPDRPQARALLEAVAAPGRDFDAIVIGGADRAFSGGQLQQILPILNRHGVALWLPELDGPLDAGNPVHQALILILGHDARRESPTGPVPDPDRYEGVGPRRGPFPGRAPAVWLPARGRRTASQP